MTPWKFTSALRHVVARTRDDGGAESCLASLLPAAELAGVLDPDPPASPTPEERDAAVARQYQKLMALRGMTPSQVQAWVDANIADLASAKDAIKTLAIAICILARRI